MARAGWVASTAQGSLGVSKGHLLFLRRACHRCLSWHHRNQATPLSRRTQSACHVKAVGFKPHTTFPLGGYYRAGVDAECKEIVGSGAIPTNTPDVQFKVLNIKLDLQ